MMCIAALAAAPMSRAHAQEVHAPVTRWTRVQDFPGGIDIAVEDVRVPSGTDFTYYCLTQWNVGAVGGGNAGLQQGGSDHFGRYVRMTLWAPANGEPITAVYKDAQFPVFVDAFDGAGTGVAVSWGFEWADSVWYTMVVRVWAHENHSRWGLWLRDRGVARWFHAVTLDFPVAGVTMGPRVGGFLEDVLGTRLWTREMHETNERRRLAVSGEWTDIAVQAFHASRSDNFQAGTVDEPGNYYFWHKAGGDLVPNLEAEGEEAELANFATGPGLEIAVVDTLVAGYDPETRRVSLSWVLAPDSTPQFGWSMEIYAADTGEVWASDAGVSSEARSVVADASVAAAGKHCVRLVLRDLFGRFVEPATAEFTLGPADEATGECGDFDGDGDGDGDGAGDDEQAEKPSGTEGGSSGASTSPGAEGGDGGCGCSGVGTGRTGAAAGAWLWLVGVARWGSGVAARTNAARRAARQAPPRVCRAVARRWRRAYTPRE